MCAFRLSSQPHSPAIVQRERAGTQSHTENEPPAEQAQRVDLQSLHTMSSAASRSTNLRDNAHPPEPETDSSSRVVPSDTTSDTSDEAGSSASASSSRHAAPSQAMHSENDSPFRASRPTSSSRQTQVRRRDYQDPERPRRPQLRRGTASPNCVAVRVYVSPYTRQLRSELDAMLQARIAEIHPGTWRYARCALASGALGYLVTFGAGAVMQKLLSDHFPRAAPFAFLISGALHVAAEPLGKRIRQGEVGSAAIKEARKQIKAEARRWRDLVAGASNPHPGGNWNAYWKARKSLFLYMDAVFCIFINFLAWKGAVPTAFQVYNFYDHKQPFGALNDYVTHLAAGMAAGSLVAYTSALIRWELNTGSFEPRKTQEMLLKEQAYLGSRLHDLEQTKKNSPQGNATALNQLMRDTRSDNAKVRNELKSFGAMPADFRDMFSSGTNLVTRQTGKLGITLASMLARMEVLLPFVLATHYINEAIAEEPDSFTLRLVRDTLLPILLIGCFCARFDLTALNRLLFAGLLGLGDRVRPTQAALDTLDNVVEVPSKVELVPVDGDQEDASATPDDSSEAEGGATVPESESEIVTVQDSDTDIESDDEVLV